MKYKLYKKWLISLLMASTFTSVSCQTPKAQSKLPKLAQGQTWQLIFEDNFDGDKLAANKWTRTVMNRNAISPDFKVRWTPKSFKVKDGELSITTSYIGKDKETGKHLFHTGGIRSIGKFESGFGFYEARVKILKGVPGVNSAFWLMSPQVGNADNSGRDGTEIDVIEMPWHTGRIQHALHWDGYGEAHQHISQRFDPSSSLQAGKWITVAVWWKADEYIFYINGKESWKTNAGGVSQAKNAHLLLSSMVTAPWGLKKGDEFKRDHLPLEFKVDYVRVYATNAENKFISSILPDSSFENEGWELNPRKKQDFCEFLYTTSIDERMHGAKALKVKVLEVGKKTSYRIKAKSALNLQSNTKYQLSFYAKSNNHQGLINLVIAHDGKELNEGFKMSKKIQKFKIATQWSKYDMTFTTGDLTAVADQTYMTFHFSAEATYWLDQVSVTAVSAK